MDRDCVFTQHRPQHTTGLRPPPQWSLGKQVKDTPQVNIKLIKLCFKYCVPLSFLYLVLSVSSICIPVIGKILRETGKKRRWKIPGSLRLVPTWGDLARWAEEMLVQGEEQTQPGKNLLPIQQDAYCTQRFIVASPSVAKGGATQGSTDGQMDKENLVRIYSGILFSLKMEWNSDPCYDGDEPWEYAMWSQSVTKDNILGFHLDEVPRTDKLTETESGMVVSRAGEEGLGLTVSQAFR